jgi:hypothetical protein
MPMISTASFTRPANTTAYADGDLVANNATAASVVPLKFTTSRVVGQGTIARVRLYKSAASATNANFTLHLFSADPGVPTNGDNGAFGIASAEDHIGSVDCDMTTGGLAGTAGLSKAFAITNGLTFDLTGATSGERRLYGLLVAKAAYTPASGETLSVTIEIMN